MAENCCVMCLRSRVLRTRRHVLRDDRPAIRPQFAEYVQQNALIQVCTYLLLYHILTFQYIRPNIDLIMLLNKKFLYL